MSFHVISVVFQADVCRELGIKLVDGLGEKVQSSRGCPVMSADGIVDIIGPKSSV